MLQLDYLDIDSPIKSKEYLDFVNERFQERKHDIKQYIVRAIAKKIRKIPEIKFIIDSTEHEASRVNKIISNLDIPPTK